VILNTLSLHMMISHFLGRVW